MKSLKLSSAIMNCALNCSDSKQKPLCLDDTFTKIYCRTSVFEETCLLGSGRREVHFCISKPFL